ncbi:hypothetical protein EI94DRAFT_169247 [Lactarius quietus]|nr:hypothetical protein EI94DRAFT_169247 [Lactarius quietus]
MISHCTLVTYYKKSGRLLSSPSAIKALRPCSSFPSASSNVVAVVIGRVLEHRLCCGPNGNYLNLDSEFITLATAKFQLQLGRPIGTVFAIDYDKVLENAAKIQAQVASTQDRRNFIIPDGASWNLRFARKVFQKRDHIITEPDKVYLDDHTDLHMKDKSNPANLAEKSGECSTAQGKENEDHIATSPEPTVPINKEEGEVAEAVDDETEHWPVPPRLREELNKIKFEYRAVPLAVYVNDTFIEPANVNNAIKGALVELHFELHHFAIRKKAQDSFNATIEQIIVLRPGEACPVTAYKRKNPRDGPIRVKVTIFLQKRIGEGSGKTDEHATDKENEGPSMSKKRRSTQKAKESENDVGASMSEKRRGKQRAKESEDEVEEDVEKKCD